MRPPSVEQALQVALHVNVDALVHRVLLQRADHFQPGAVANMGQARVAMAAEVALQNQTFFGAVEKRAPFLELEHAIGRFLGVDLRHAPVVEQLAAAHGVAKVHFPVVFGIDVAHRRGDAAFRHDGVGFAEQRFADQSGLDALRRCFDGGAQAGAASADDHDVVFVGFVLFFSH